MKIIDLRSDTVTWPTEEMRQAMLQAPVGDDVFGDDPTGNQLEELSAKMLNKEAAIFMPTGTMGNQAALMAHTHPGDELIASSGCHLVCNEAGGAARLSGVSWAMVDRPKLRADDIHGLVRSDNIHYPRTKLVWQENALGNGEVVTLEEMEEVFQAAKEHDLKIHLDGARLFNAAVALGVEAAELAARADSVSFCLSKGLCSPAGSVVCGPADFIGEVRRCRKLLGGGMRQIGVLAACGLLSLSKMVAGLARDHAQARLLENFLGEIPHISLSPGQINMVFFQINIPNFDHQALQDFLAGRGIIILPPSGGAYRLVTHHYVSPQDVEFVADSFKTALHP